MGRVARASQRSFGSGRAVQSGRSASTQRSLAGDGRQLDSQETARKNASTSGRDGLARREPRQIRVDHHLDQLLEVDLRLPTQDPLRFRRIADQVVDFGGPQELRIDA